LADNERFYDLGGLNYGSQAEEFVLLRTILAFSMHGDFVDFFFAAQINTAASLRPPDQNNDHHVHTIIIHPHLAGKEGLGHV
jgi:hypothetical protein